MVSTPYVDNQLGPYRVISVLGEGGMSVVYRAQRISDGAQVALKVMAPELARNASFRDRFVRESRIATALDHPHVVPVYEAGEADGSFYIAMRLVEGPDLKRVIEEQAPLEVERTVHILNQVASALDAAHAAGMVHRDVKPQNVLLEREPSTGEENAFLCDFGLTKHATSQSRVTQTGELVGSTHYMAPEQIEGARDIDRRTDVYALGCVLYECLTGKPPYQKDTEVAVLWAHMNSTPPSLTLRRRDLPRGVDDVIRMALAKHPHERFSGCGELVRTFEQEAAGVTTKSFIKRSSLTASQVRADNELWKKGPASQRLAVKVAPPKTSGGGAGWAVGLVGVVVALGALVLARSNERIGGAIRDAVPDAVADVVTGEDGPSDDERNAKGSGGERSADGDQDPKRSRDRRARSRGAPSRRDGERPQLAVDAPTGTGDQTDQVAQPRDEPEQPALPKMPASGTYVFRQEGYEDVCSEISSYCSSPDDPPKTYQLQVARRVFSYERAQVLTTAAYTPRWESTVTTEYTHVGAAITAIDMRFQIEESFRVELHPTPALRLLDYPIRRGQRWSLDWSDADDEGTFRASVVQSDSLRIAGRTLRTDRIHVRLGFDSNRFFEADFWVDRSNNMIVKSVGTIEAGPARSYYRYGFTMKLKSGPGY